MLKDKFYWVETDAGTCPVYTLLPTSPSPAVLFCHDYKGSSHETNRFFWRLSRVLYKHGIGSVRFDYNGFGNSSADSTDFTMETALNDTVSVFQKIAALPDIDPDNLAILGLGLGGRIAAFLLGNSDDLKAGILLNPADTHFKQPVELEELQFGFEGDTTWDDGWEFSKELFTQENFGEGSDDLKETEADVLIITGYDDDFIFHKTSEAYIEKTPSALYEELMDANHFFASPEAWNELTEKVTAFLTKNLLGITQSDTAPTTTNEKTPKIPTNPPLAEQIEHTETVTADETEKDKEDENDNALTSTNGSEVVIKDKLPPGVTLKTKDENN